MIGRELTTEAMNGGVRQSRQGEQNRWPTQHSAYSIAVLTQQISHYHLARYRAAAPCFKKLSIISVMNAADFEEFLSLDHLELDVIRLFEGKSSYLAAVENGILWSTTIAALDAIKPEVVAVAGWSFPESLAAIAWARTNSAKVIMMSASQRVDAKRHAWRERIKSRVVTACDTALVGGDMQRDYIVALGMQSESTFLGYDAVDNRHFEEGAARARTQAAVLRATHGLPERYLLASARFIPKKNLVRLVLAFADAVATTGTAHSLVILGDGPGRVGLDTAIAAAGLQDRVQLPGFKDYRILPVYYGLADGF